MAKLKVRGAGAFDFQVCRMFLIECILLMCRAACQDFLSAFSHTAKFFGRCPEVFAGRPTHENSISDPGFVRGREQGRGLSDVATRLSDERAVCIRGLKPHG